MRTVWKFPIVVTDRQHVIMPSGARVLAVHPQHEQLCLWAVVDPDAPKTATLIHIAGTGHQLPDDIDQFRYAGTAHLHAGALVLHVFLRDAAAAT